MDDRRTSSVIAGALFLALGGLFGWSIGKERAWNETADWAVETTRSCEATFQTEDFSSVTQCLQAAIDNIRENQKEEDRAEGYDPMG